MLTDVSDTSKVLASAFEDAVMLISQTLHFRSPPFQNPKTLNLFAAAFEDAVDDAGRMLRMDSMQSAPSGMTSVRGRLDQAGLLEDILGGDSTGNTGAVTPIGGMSVSF